MCWITLTPSKSKNKEKRASSDCSSAEIVRVQHTPHPRFNKVSISLPSTVTVTSPHHHDTLHHHPHLPKHIRPAPPVPHTLLRHHHRHPHLHLHPLHMHPISPLHGPGKKIRIEPTPPPPPQHPSRCRAPPSPTVLSSSSSSSSSSAAGKTTDKEPIYRTQIVEPAAVRAGTRSALRDVRARGRMRRVGGYEVLGKSVPWDWECVSSTGGSRVGGGAGKGKGNWKRKRSGGLKYPPFAGMERWM